MALEFLKKLERSSLLKEFNKRPDRPKKDPMPKRRQTVINGIDKALAALKAGEDKPKGAYYRTKPHTDVMLCKVKYGSRVLTLDGETEHPTRDATSFYKDARRAAEKGELDNAINASLEGKTTATRSTGTRKPRGPMDPEKVYQRNLQRYGKERADELRARSSN